jgi:regulator of protease activity HflC (stomatin/prohibitin superfamily)
MGIGIIARFLNTANNTLDIVFPWVAIVGIIWAGIRLLIKDKKKHTEKKNEKSAKIKNAEWETIAKVLRLYLICLWLPVQIYKLTGSEWLPALIYKLTGSEWVSSSFKWVVLFLGDALVFIILLITLIILFIIYPTSKRYGERRGLYSSLGHVSILFLGLFLGRWLGIFLFSMPLLFVYYFTLYQFAIAIIPTKKPDGKLALLDKNNEKRQQFAALVSYMWGIQYPAFVVADEWGREWPMRIQGSLFKKFGSPGIILTHAHQVAGITAGTEFSRIEGPGSIFISRFERILEIVDLRRQVRNSWIDFITKDGIPCKAKLFMVFKVNDSSPDQSEGSFPYSRKWVRRLLRLLGVTRTGADDKTAVRWDERVVKLIEQAARQTLSQRTLNELWQPKDRNSNTFVEIGEETKSLLQKRLEEQGVIVFTARTVDFQFSEKQQDDSIIGQQLATWKSSWERQATQTLAEGEAEANRLQEEARAYAQSMLLKALAEGIQQVTPEMSRYVIAIRYISAIQELMKTREITENLGKETPTLLENIKQQIS